MNDLVSRAVRAVIAGIIAGIVVGLLLFVVSALLPGIQIAAGFWALIVGILVGLYTFVSGSNPVV